MHSMIHVVLNKTKIGGVALAAAAALALTGCGGGSGTSTASSSTVTGQFVDAPVAGLSYKCGTSTIMGTTDANGYYTCNAGESVGFYVGDILLGSVASAQTVVTPLDLVGLGAKPTDLAVSNIVRFLLSISTTDTAGNLVIDTNAVTNAKGKTVNFKTIASTDLDTMITTVKPGATLHTQTDAENHMRDSIYKLFAKSYAGTYGGSSSGTWSLSISATNGSVTGEYIDPVNGNGSISGQMSTDMSVSSTYGFTGTAGSATWSGTLNVSTGVFSGTWDSGTFTGKVATTPAPAAAGGGAGGTLIVSGVTPSTGNGNFALSMGVETAAGGSSTAKRVEFADPTTATRKLRLYYQPSTGALENIQYESTEKSFNCFVGDPMMGCHTAKITFSASGKSILLDLAEFKSGTTVNGVLEGLLSW